MSRYRPTRSILCIVALLAMGAPALASANVSCQIDDANLAFELQAIAGRSGPIVQVQAGTIAIKPSAARAAAQLTFGHTNIVQQWDLDDDMRLQIEVGDEKSKATVNLVIFARLNKATDKYSGRYVLKISRAGKTHELKGRIKECVAG